MKSYLINCLGIALFLMAITIVLPMASAWSTSKLGGWGKSQLIHEWNDSSQVTIGGLGVIVHELGHLIVALIFGHKITKARLLQIFSYKHSDTIGYVDQNYDPDNQYQCMGNFATSIAPFYACSGVLWWIHHWLLGTRLDLASSFNTMAIPKLLWQNLKVDIMNNVHADYQSPLMFLLFLVFMVLISLTGYDLSDEDIKGMLKGLWPWTLWFGGISIVVALIFSNFAVFNIYVWDFVSVFLILMLNSWIYILLSSVIIKIIRFAVDYLESKIKKGHHYAGK